jgi:aminopeptidase N
MLHTFRKILNNDAQWIKLLHDIQHHFRHQTITADALVKFISKQTQTDYQYFFDQYLHYTELPELQLKLTPKGKDFQLSYRWQANVSNFRMPVSVTVASGQFAFIYPTPEWKTMTLKNMTAEEFDVDDENFYLQVKIE